MAGYGDVPSGTYYTDAVQWSRDNGITGNDGCSFLPDAAVSRAETAVWLHNMEGRPDPGDAHGFDDITDDAHNDAVSWLANTGITTGVSETMFAPDNTLTRAQVAVFLYRLEGEPTGAPPHKFTDVPEGWRTAGVSWMANTGITTGVSETMFAPDDTLTRAQLITFLYRYKDTPPVEINPDSPTPNTTTPDTGGELFTDVMEWRCGDKLHRDDGPASIWYYEDGTIGGEVYYRDGEIYRDVGPAGIWYHVTGTIWQENYYRDGLQHRDDGPAGIWYDLDGTIGGEFYYRDGKLHRDDGPASISYGEESILFERYYRDGERHRVDGPAFIWYREDGSIGREEYYRDGLRHRDDGPAFIWYREDGSIEEESYYRNGERVDPPAS